MFSPSPRLLHALALRGEFRQGGGSGRISGGGGGTGGGWGGHNNNIFSPEMPPTPKKSMINYLILHFWTTIKISAIK